MFWCDKRTLTYMQLL